MESMNQRESSGEPSTGGGRWTIAAIPAAISRGIDWFASPSVRSDNHDVLHRGRVVVTFGLTLVSLAIVYAAVLFSMNSPIGAAVLGMGVGLALVSLWVMHRTGSCFAAGNLFSVTFFVVLTALACRLGGHGSIALPWYATVPVVALSTVGRRSAMFWLAVTTLSLATFYALDCCGYSFPNDLTPQNYSLLGLIAWTGMILLVIGLALLYETARDRMLRLVRDSRQRYRAVVEDTPLLICTYLPDTTLTFVNEAYCRCFRRSREELIGRSFLELIPEEVHATVRETIGSLTATEQVQVAEHQVFAADGEVRWQRWINRAILDPDDRLVAGQAIGEDITERKRAEEKLRREKEMSDNIINSLPGLFYILDEERFVRWNERWESVTGYSAEELAGMYGTDFFEGAAKELISQRMQVVFRDGSADAEAEITTKDGRRIPYYLTGLRTMLDGKPHLVGLGIDITARKQVEAELASARDQAEAATRAKSEFLANMSHEIRTPMTAILGFSDVLLESTGDQDQLEAATTIKQNGEYLIGIINDILDLSKIEAGKLEVESVQCSPCQILSEVISLMRVRANAKNLPLQIEYEGPIPESIQSDPTRLRQILINLIGNSIKFTEVGEVRLEVRLLDAKSDQAKMQFDVVDSGIGMTEEQIGELFKPFSQVDTSATRKHGGTGLGLTISKRLAEGLGGDIAVTSAPGEGSTFTVTVTAGPLDGVRLLDNPTEAQITRVPDTGRTTSTTKLDCRVLLAEDGPDNQRLIAFLLKKAGAEVAVAENGLVARDLALAARDEGTSFDVVLMDMQMPVMDGYEATTKLREAGYTGPIVALTAHAMSTDRDKCLAAGCDGYMTKPIDRKKLISLVGEYASRRKPLASG